MQILTNASPTAIHVTPMQFAKIRLDRTNVIVSLDMLLLVNHAMLMNATPRTINATPMHFVQIVWDHIIVIVLLDMLVMVHLVKVRYTRI